MREAYRLHGTDLIDEPTTGLDAGAAIKVGLVLRVVANLQLPVLCALLQPGNELLHLFDKESCFPLNRVLRPIHSLQVLLLTHGRVAYWGPVKEALPYFERLGFLRPAEYSEAEFLAAVVERPEDFQRGAE